MFSEQQGIDIISIVPLTFKASAVSVCEILFGSPSLEVNFVHRQRYVTGSLEYVQGLDEYETLFIESFGGKMNSCV